MTLYEALKGRFGLSDTCGECPHHNRDCYTQNVNLHDICEVMNAPGMKPKGEWISVKDRLPEAGKHVLADCEIRLIGGRKNHYVCEAYYAPTHTISVGSTTDYDECYEYDEMDDEYYLLEGWYECIHNWDDYSSVVIGDFVTHWMPIPEPPKMEGGEMDD